MSNLTININDTALIDGIVKVKECCPCDPEIMQRLAQKWDILVFMLGFVLLVWTYDVVINRGGFKKFIADWKERTKEEHEYGKSEYESDSEDSKL